MVAHLTRLSLEGGAIPLPGFGHLLEEGCEAWTAIPVGRGEVGPREERLLVWSQEDGHGPAPLSPVERQGRRHVDLVEVGPLFPVRLDADEVLVHEGGDALVFESSRSMT
jgi:hypothetical protein